MLYRPSNSVTERLKGLFKKRIGDGEIAYLGDSLLPGARVDVPGRPGYVYVRFPYGRDANGNTLFTPPTMARSSGVAYLSYPGAAVVVAVKYNNELEIVSAHHQSLDAAGINTATLNPLNQQSKFVYPWQLTMGLASAVATAITASTLVMVKSFRHYTGGLFFQTFETPLLADKIDLASYIPATDMHCYACLWIDTYLNVAVVTTSVAQALNVALDATDINELIVRTASSRPPDGIPLKAFYLSNDQSTITQNALDVDVRQWLNTPHIWGFPNVLTTLERIWANRTLVTGPFTTSGVGALDTGESGALHIIVHKNNLDATTAPTVTDDSSDGYSVESAWYDKITGLLYIAADVTVGAAVWNVVTSGGGSFAPDDATYLLQVADGSLPNAQAMGALTTGIVKNTTTTGVQSIAISNTDYLPPTSPVMSSATINTSITGTAIIDDATFASPSSTTVPTTNAVKGYVDQTVLGLNAKADVRLATAAALPAVVYANGASGVGATLTAVSIGVLTIDGVTVALNDRLLIKDQVAGLQDGIYKCTVAGAIGVAFVLTRSTDGDTDGELRGGWMISVEGTANATQAWVNTNTSAITFGTTAITFGEFSAGVIAAGTGLTKSGNTISLITPVTIANGGTNATTKPDAFDSLAPTTTQGDMIYHDGSDNVRLPKGTALQYLRMNAGATAEEWATLAAVKALTVNWQYFNASGTWTKPSGAVLVRVICVGGGGGGASGRRGAAASDRFGGGGGAGGFVTDLWYDAGELGSSETITIGIAGTGGGARGTDNANGISGNTGGTSYFGGSTAANSKQAASGGGGGAAGTTTAGTSTGGVGNTALSTEFQFYGSTGGNGGANGTFPNGEFGHIGAWGPAAGGGGGGINSSNTATSGGGGGGAQLPAFRLLNTSGGANGSGTGGAPGNAGGGGTGGTTDGSGPFLFGSGGGGGGPNLGVGFAGGAGAAPGGGGGGGSASLNGNNSGAGADGGGGGVFVITYVWA